MNSMDTAPKGNGGVIKYVTDPAYIEPPMILLFFEDGQAAVCHWDWYYAEGGSGYREGLSAWIEPLSGEQVCLMYDEPTGWMNIPRESQSGGEDGAA